MSTNLLQLSNYNQCLYRWIDFNPSSIFKVIAADYWPRPIYNQTTSLYALNFGALGGFVGQQLTHGLLDIGVDTLIQDAQIHHRYPNHDELPATIGNFLRRFQCLDNYSTNGNETLSMSVAMSLVEITR